MDSQKVSPQVILDAQKGCKRAENKLYNSYNKFVWNFIRKKSVRKDDLDILHSDIFIKIFKHLHKFDANIPDAYVYTITKSMIRDYNKKLPPLKMVVDFEIVENTKSALDEMIEKESILEIENLLEAFKRKTSDKHFSVLEKVIEGYTYKEIYEEDKSRTNSMGTIKSRLNTVRRQFKDFLNEQK